MIELLLQAERTLAMGRLEEAERLYRQALERDPRNAIAVVGLARLAIERGEDVEAFGLAARALELDPENAAAQRIAVRLQEVLGTRGERVELPAAFERGRRAGSDGPMAGARSWLDRVLRRTRRPTARRR
jgi:tetratricopeptide (TPR) repeat protein